MNKIVNLDFDDMTESADNYMIAIQCTRYNKCKPIVIVSLTGLLIGKRKIIARILVFGNYLPWYFVKELF